MLTTTRKKTLFDFPTIEDSFREFDRIFNKNYSFNNFKTVKSNFLEKDDSFILETLVPRIKKEDLEISLDGNSLTVEFNKDETKKESEKNYTLKEFYSESFKRKFKLPEHIDVDKISSKCENGILYIEIPKLEKNSKRKIFID
jgi:HSP20 family protein